MDIVDYIRHHPALEVIANYCLVIDDACGCLHYDTDLNVETVKRQLEIVVTSAKILLENAEYLQEQFVENTVS